MISRRNRKGGARQRSLPGVLAQSLSGVAEAGFLMAAADGEISEEELLVVAAVVAGALDGQVTEDQLMDIFEACDNALENDGWEARAEVMASHIEGDEARQLALFTAAAVLIADDSFTEGDEDEAFLQLAEALGASSDEAAGAIEEALAAYELAPGFNRRTVAV